MNVPDNIYGCLSGFFPKILFLRLLIFRTILDSDLSVLYLQEGIDQKFGNRKYPHVSFAVYLENGPS